MPSTQIRKVDGFYFVVVDGVPPHCQWQELKDYLRDSAKVNPGYANVLKINEDGTRVGFCPLRNKGEANKAFDFLVAEGWRGLNIRVSMIWKADMSSELIERRRGPEQSCRRKLQSTTPPLSSFTSGTAQTRASPGLAAFNMRSMAHAPNVQHLPVSYPQYPQDLRRMMPQDFAETPSMAMNRENWPPSEALPSVPFKTSLNQEHRVYVDRQSIHITRLPHDIKTPELKAILLRYGHVSDVSIKRGKEKRCSATAKFKRSSEAAKAIHELDGRPLGKYNLVVRLDRGEAGNISSTNSVASRSSDSDSSASQNSVKQTPPRCGPLVVNGVRGPNYKRQHRDDDSEDTSTSDDDDDNGDEKE